MNKILIVLVNEDKPVTLYVDPFNEQTAPEIDVVQVLVGVKSVGTINPIASRLGLGALMVNGDVMEMVIVDVDSKTNELEGV